ncbi:type VII secretion integral membrane protein EccD [Streptomyces nitrosporeus]|uniref:Type VII secretion integral membrane protein EccD n=1 Tax=Streptomyces nitrosporeus TaxID=28894 RepID=A0A5J6F6G7_9ACTN|nr:type VII secretion integral membrane protein EccD [Streptomyces nitrosporeus]QEU71583.1 type VII secretion integral membrane protein EccD [Streptomyces nitrosporeus]GGZ11568.1 type VII secretion integral membrane protein EccD [Streptomyces nitrosporeus]
MTDISAPGLCRLTVRTPERLIDLAVPADVPVADLLPILLDHAGEGLAEKGIEHGGWILQRLGEEPLDEESTPEALSLRDGETLLLRPRNDALPAIHFDDLVDGVATTMRERPHGWAAHTSRWLLRGTAVVLLAAGLLVPALPGGSPALRAAVAAGTGLLVLFGAASASRAVGDSAAGAALGVLVAPYLALAGWLLPTGDTGPQLLGSRLLAASAAAAGGAVLSVAAVAAFVPLLMCAAVIAAAGAVWGVLMLTMDVPASHAASIVAVAAVAFGGMVPGMSFRLSGLRLPALPADAGQLQEGIEPHPHQRVVDRTALAEEWMTALYAATGLVCAGVLTALVLDRPGTASQVTAAVLSVLLLLHARGIGNVWQRPAVMLPGLYGLVLMAVHAAAVLTPGQRPALLASMLALAATAAIASWTVPGRRMIPHWGRAADIAHSLAAVALIPLALWVLGVYSALRTATG